MSDSNSQLFLKIHQTIFFKDFVFLTCNLSKHNVYFLHGIQIVHVMYHNFLSVVYYDYTKKNIYIKKNNNLCTFLYFLNFDNQKL